MSLFSIPVFPLNTLPSRLAHAQARSHHQSRTQTLIQSSIQSQPWLNDQAEPSSDHPSLAIDHVRPSVLGVPGVSRAAGFPGEIAPVTAMATIMGMTASLPEFSICALTDEPTPGHEDDPAIDAVMDCKGEHTISVCIPAHNEERTIGTIVSVLRAELVVKRQLVDEIIVMDDRSTDGTAQVAQAAGALVVSTNEVCVADGPSQGKGDALARSIVAARGSIVVWIDADLEDMAPSIVARLVAPLLLNQGAHLTKGYFARRQADGSVAGGRVTELVARPLLRLCFPAFVPPREPLSGMCAIRRTTAARLRYERDFGVDIGVVLDIFRKHGRAAIIDVDLGEITHRHHDLAVLSVQATAVARTILARAQHPALAKV
jgi:glucosyl-3-phosphoglycerate synthase